MLTQYAFSILFIDKKKAKFSNDRFGFKATHVDAHDLITFKFVTDDIPDPSKIFIFHNKRYICQKIEMNVTDDGIDKEKTGYFYEIL